MSHLTGLDLQFLKVLLKSLRSRGFNKTFSRNSSFYNSFLVLCNLLQVLNALGFLGSTLIRSSEFLEQKEKTQIRLLLLRSSLI